MHYHKLMPHQPAGCDRSEYCARIAAARSSSILNSLKAFCQNRFQSPHNHRQALQRCFMIICISILVLIILIILIILIMFHMWKVMWYCAWKLLLRAAKTLIQPTLPSLVSFQFRPWATASDQEVVYDGAALHAQAAWRFWSPWFSFTGSHGLYADMDQLLM